MPMLLFPRRATGGSTDYNVAVLATSGGYAYAPISTERSVAVRATAGADPRAAISGSVSLASVATAGAEPRAALITPEAPVAVLATAGADPRATIYGEVNVATVATAGADPRAAISGSVSLATVATGGAAPRGGDGGATLLSTGFESAGDEADFAAGTDSSVTRTNAQAQAGTWSIEVAATADGSPTQVLYGSPLVGDPPVPAAPGELVTVTMWVLAGTGSAGSTVTLAVAALDAVDFQIASFSVESDALSATWQQVTVSAVMPVDTVGFSFELYASGLSGWPTGDSYFVDTVAVSRLNIYGEVSLAAVATAGADPRAAISGEVSLPVRAEAGATAYALTDEVYEVAVLATAGGYAYAGSATYEDTEAGQTHQVYGARLKVRPRFRHPWED